MQQKQDVCHNADVRIFPLIITYYWGSKWQVWQGQGQGIE
jgi:hypothetical protein